MSTRCQIGFYPEKPEAKNLDQHEALIYRHSDGYPGKADGSEYGVLAVMIPFLKKFHGNRGLSDIEYAGARTLQHLTNEYDGILDNSVSKKPDHFDYLGYGICRAFHGDIEYFYAVYPAGVDVYSPGFDEPHEKWHLSETINL